MPIYILLLSSMWTSPPLAQQKSPASSQGQKDRKAKNKPKSQIKTSSDKLPKGSQNQIDVTNRFESLELMDDDSPNDQQQQPPRETSSSQDPGGRRLSKLPE